MTYLTSASTTNVRKFDFDSSSTLNFLSVLFITTGRFDSAMVQKVFRSEFQCYGLLSQKVFCKMVTTGG